MDNQYKLLSVVCKLYDGKHYVSEEAIRKKWKKCPEHTVIFNIAVGEYLDSNLDSKNPGYIPTQRGLEVVRNRKRDNVIFLITGATLVLTAVQFFMSFL